MGTLIKKFFIVLVTILAATGFITENKKPVRDIEEKAIQEEISINNMKSYSDEDAILIAKAIYGEALVTDSDMEMSAVAWCILNRVDSALFPDTVKEVVSQPYQFLGYKEDGEYSERTLKIAYDVLERHSCEKVNENVGRVLPEGYFYFEGDGYHNYFYDDFEGKEFYEWTMENPYDN